MCPVVRKVCNTELSHSRGPLQTLNSLYQPILDRYIAGEDIPFTEARKVWRNTAQQMCDSSGFFEQLFLLVRKINQRLPPGKKLRVLAGDSPVDWDQLTPISIKDAPKRFFEHRFLRADFRM